MEECIKLRDDGGCGGGGDGIDDGNTIKNLRFAFDLNFQIEKYRFDFCKQSLRSLFDQVVVAFLRDKCAGKCHRPIPALCGDGRPVDLFKLFWIVRKFGGYEAVSQNKLWGFVSEECGLGCGVIASIKLIYMSYLNELDQWLQQVFSKRVLEDDHCGFIRKLDLFSREVEIRYGGKKRQEQLEKVISFAGEADDWDHITIADFAASVNSAAAKTIHEVNDSDDSRKSFSEYGDDTTKLVKKLTAYINNKILNYRESTTATAVEKYGKKSSTRENNGSGISAKKVVKKVASSEHAHAEKAANGERVGSQPVFDNLIPSKSDAVNALTSRKRKQHTHSFSGMLGWLIQVAKRSDDRSVGSMPECSKWSEYGCAEFWAQALLVREAWLIRKTDSRAAGEVLKDQDQLKKPRMLPSMYEDDVINHQTRERLRHSKRIPLTKSNSCPCCKTSAAPHTRDSIHRETDVSWPRAPSEAVEEKPSHMNDHEPDDDPAEREVSIGRRFQAEVPEWTGTAFISDPKWLGTKMWPSEDGEKNSTARLDAIGKGRQNQCDCSYRDSVDCVRFHVAEKRLKLKQELGLLFYQWRFNLMGEDVSLSWTEEEETIFKDNMKSYAAFSNKFWNKAWKFLPSKSRDKLVSYYFNVYLVQRRSYQNRVTPGDADSDDDEKDCGSIGGSFGYKTLHMPSSSSTSCNLNTESTEFV